MSTASQDPLTSSPPFPAHARTVVRAVRAAFTDLVRAAGADPQAPQSITRSLAVNKNLAWKIAKIIQSDDPSVVLQQMPGTSGISIFLRSAAKAGVDSTLLNSAGAAVKAYEELIELHSGDRATLEMMGSELSADGRQQRDEHHRKLLYQGASYVWGAQTRVILKLGVVGPSATPGHLDFASISGLIDFRRLRPGVNWVMASRQSDNDDGTAMATAATEAVDTRFEDAARAPLMADFCSQPLPELQRYVDGPLYRYELVDGPVGNTGALTCVVGAIQRNIPYYRTPANEWGAHLAKCDIPAELMMLDVFFHRDFTFALSPEVSLYSEVGASMRQENRNRYRLPMHERLQDLGSDSVPPATPEVPHFSRMIQQVFERLGWSAREFHGFRLKITYPAYPTSVILRYRLPEAPPT
jgi:hypothetical protein